MCTVGAAAWCEDARAIAKAADDVWLVERDPILYSVAESGERDADISLVVKDYFSAEEACVALLKG
jgi:hypothetical protein